MITIRPIRKKDFNTARKFAVEGMLFDRYVRHPLALYLYSKYFWYLELCRATVALGAYRGDRLVGVLLAAMQNEPKAFDSLRHRAFVAFCTFVMNLAYRGASGPYDSANQRMLDAFTASHRPDGEIVCFAADPQSKGQGIGTLLLDELARRAPGKLIYLFTDSHCTYQFYTRRGFEQSGKEEVCLKIGKTIPLTCFLFSKRL